MSRMSWVRSRILRRVSLAIAAACEGERLRSKIELSASAACAQHDLVQLAAADQVARVGLVPELHHLVDDLDAGGPRQLVQLGHRAQRRGLVARGHRDQHRPPRASDRPLAGRRRQLVLELDDARHQVVRDIAEKSEPPRPPRACSRRSPAAGGRSNTTPGNPCGPTPTAATRSSRSSARSVRSSRESGSDFKCVCTSRSPRRRACPARARPMSGRTRRPASPTTTHSTSPFRDSNTPSWRFSSALSSVEVAGQLGADRARRDRTRRR